MSGYELSAEAGTEYEGPYDHAYRNLPLEEYLGVGEGYSGDSIAPEDEGPNDIIPEEPPLNT
jgi:hypothetical protein